jgi:polysaccharide chain length determinant protein (PEP-CTERM system associated)
MTANGGPAAASRQRLRPEALARIGWRRKWQIVLPAIVIATAAAWWVHRLPDRYRSESLLLVLPQRGPETFVRSTVTTRASVRLQAAIQQILSRTQLERVIHDFDLYAEDRKIDGLEDVVETMRTRDIEIQVVKGDAFRLGFTAAAPDVALRVAGRLVSLFIVETSLDRATLADGTDRFLEAQLEDARSRLVENEAKLEEYRRRHNGELPTQVEANLRGLQNTEMQMQVLAESLNRDRDRHLMLERSLKEANLRELVDLPVSAAPDPSKLTTRERLERAEAALTEMRMTLTGQHPDIVTMQQTIADLRRQRAAEGEGAAASVEARRERLRESRIEDLRSELAVVQRQIAEKTDEGARLRGALLDYQRRLQAAPTREAELAALTRDYDTLQQTYRGLLSKKQESAIAADLERQQIGAHFKVLDPPRLPEQPFAPKRRQLYAIAVLGALGIGLMFAGTLEWFDRTVRTQADVFEALGLPVLAAIPAVRGNSR